MLLVSAKEKKAPAAFHVHSYVRLHGAGEGENANGNEREKRERQIRIFLEKVRVANTLSNGAS
jgi:hypothetical protein